MNKEYRSVDVEKVTPDTELTVMHLQWMNHWVSAMRPSR